MKFKSLLAIMTLTSIFTAGNFTANIVNKNGGIAVAQEMKDGTGMTPQQHIEMITKNKGQFGSGDAMRRFFFGDLEPVGIQPGGAGMVVNLFNKKNNVTFSYCSTFDVVVAVRQGKTTKFPAAEVK